MSTQITNIAKRSSLYIFLGLLAYAPLHILLSTWIGTSFGVLDIAKVFKDGVLVVGFLLALTVSVKQAWFKHVLRDRLVWLIVAYAALTVLLAAIKPTDSDAEVLGVVYNTRFLLFFLYGLLLARLFPAKQLIQTATRVALGAGLIVVVFGIFQYLVLPNDALNHLGYSRANGVLPAFFIDEKPDLERVMSTLRDPNSLGSYLIIIGMLLVAKLTVIKRQKQKVLWGLALFLTLLCLWYTFSRSGQLGFILALGVFVLLAQTKLKQTLLRHKKLVGTVLTVLIIVLGFGFVAARNTYLVQNVIFHADQKTVLEDPNQLRVRFWRESAQQIVHNPEGGGPGTAGLASIRNDVQGTVLNENYYLQIGEEVGVVGLFLFLAILSRVVRRLFYQRDSLIALALLASLVGLMFTNFLVHIWSNEAVAYTWWGLAGLVLASLGHHPKSAIVKKK